MLFISEYLLICINLKKKKRDKMTSCSIPLMSMTDVDTHSDYDNDGFSDFDYSDSSSGYDSSDVSDTDSMTSDLSMTSHDSCHNIIPSSENRGAEVMQYQSTHALCENLKLILEMPEMCDVTFLVGPKEIPVHGVRAVMATRSRHFYNLILTHMNQQSQAEAESKKTKKIKKTSKRSSSRVAGLCRPLCDRLVIPVTKFDPEVFHGLIQFVHCGSVTITEETVVGLYCGAARFELQELSLACLDFVDRSLASGRHTALLTATRQYSQHKAVKTIFDKIYSVVDRRFISAFSEVTI